MTVNNVNESEVPENTDSPPKGGFTTPWLLCNRGFLRVNISVIGPQTKQPEGYLPLSKRQSEDILKRVTDIVELFKKELR